MTQSVFLTEAEVSQHLNVSVSTVKRWRYKGIGPKYIKVGDIVRYRREDLDAFIEAKSSDRVA